MEYKSDWKGKHLIKIDRFFPSSKQCSDCGYQNKTLKLSDREWVCEDCGSIHNRDINAAKNIKVEGMKILDTILNQNTVGTTEINACEDMSLSLDNSVQESTSFR